MSNLIIAKNTTSAGTDNIMQTSVTFLRAFTMCGTISPFSGCDNSFIKNFVNVYCPNTMCLSIFFLTKVSQSLERSDYQCPQFKSTCRVRNFPCEEQISSFCWRLTEWFTFVNRCKPQVNMFLEICFVQHVQTENIRPLFWRKLSANHNQAYTSSCPKRQKKQYLLGRIVSTSYWLLQSFENSVPVSIYTPSIYSQARWLSRSPTMLLSHLQTLDHIQLLWL